MGSCNKGQTIVMVEGFRDILAERIARTTRGDSPTTSVIWIGPEEITHGPFVWHLLYTIKGADVIEGIDARRKTTMQAEDLIVDQCSKGKVIEQIGEIFPDVGVAILSKTFIIETIYLGDLTGFVVASEDGDALGISDLEGNKQRHGLHREVASIDIITST